MLVQMFFIYLGLPALGVVLDPFACAALPIGPNTSAYQAEYFRAAMLSVPDGQMQAARSMGMGRPQALRRVCRSGPTRRSWS